MAITKTINGAELAVELAQSLTDLEFELLIRERIKLTLKQACAVNPNLSESHHRVSFRFNVTDKSEWTVGLGETYSKCGETTGEVLAVTFGDTMNIMRAREVNKLSLLLSHTAAPVDQLADWGVPA